MHSINIDNLFPRSKEKERTTPKTIDISTLFHPVAHKDKGYVDFNVDHLLQEQQERKEKIKNEYKRIFNLCLKKIKLANKLDQKDILFDVPESVFMHTKYDPLECLLFIQERLRKLFLDTFIISINQIFISWNNVESNKKEKDSET